MPETPAPADTDPIEQIRWLISMVKDHGAYFDDEDNFDGDRFVDDLNKALDGEPISSRPVLDTFDQPLAVGDLVMHGNNSATGFSYHRITRSDTIEQVVDLENCTYRYRGIYPGRYVVKVDRIGKDVSP